MHGNACRLVENREANDKAKILFQKASYITLSEEKMLILLDVLMMTSRELTRFTDYWSYAEMMCDLSKDRNDTYWHWNGKLQIISAYHMEIPYNLPFLPFRERHLGKLIVVRLMYMFLRFQFYNRKKSDRVLFLYHELLVRQYSIDVVFFTGLYHLLYDRSKIYNGIIVLYKNILVKRFEILKKEAWKKGNYFSLVGTEKYIYRLTNIVEKTNKNVNTRKAEVLKDNSAIAISERDAMIIDYENIDVHFRKSLKAAMENDNIYNIVKAYLNKASAKAGEGKSSIVGTCRGL